MRRVSQRLAEQACGRSGIAQPREHCAARRVNLTMPCRIVLLHDLLE